MTDFAAPGMAASRSEYVRRGIVAMAATCVVAMVITVIVHLTPDDDMTIAMHTTSVAGGIVSGSSVVVNGDEVGTVRAVTSPSPGDFVVDLSIDPDRLRPGLLTSDMGVMYAPKNVFGIGAVVLKTSGGGQAIGNGGDFYPAVTEDATLTTLLRNLSDLDEKAFTPYVGAILASAGQATMGLVPVVGIAGRLAEQITATQTLPTAQTFPKMAELFDSLGYTTRVILPPVRSLLDWQAPRRPGFTESQRMGLEEFAKYTIPGLGELLGKGEVADLVPFVPVVNQLLDRVVSTFPDAKLNGLQIADLIGRVDRTIHPGKNGPVVDVDVVLRGLPVIGAAVGSGGVR